MLVAAAVGVALFLIAEFSFIAEAHNVDMSGPAFYRGANAIRAVVAVQLTVVVVVTAGSGLLRRDVWIAVRNGTVAVWCLIFFSFWLQGQLAQPF